MTARDAVEDAYEASRRCLQAMDETQDVETRVALWRAAARYAELARMKRATGERLNPAALAADAQGGSFSQRAW